MLFGPFPKLARAVSSRGALKAGLDVITGSFGTSAQSFLKTETPNILRSPILQNGSAPMPFIKGVFLPKGAKNSKEVSALQLAADVVITDFPVTSGQSWDRIRNGKVSAQPEARVGDIDYLTSGHSVLGLSSNSGITFDLNAIRTANHWGPLRLTRAIDFGSRELDSTSFADFSVYLDSERKLYRPKMTTTEKSGCDLLAAIPDARAKDRGWEPAVVAMLLDEMRVEVPPEWLIREVSAAELEAFIRKLRLALAEQALPSA